MLTQRKRKVFISRVYLQIYTKKEFLTRPLQSIPRILSRNKLRSMYISLRYFWSQFSGANASLDPLDRCTVGTAI